VAGGWGGGAVTGADNWAARHEGDEPGLPCREKLPFKTPEEAGAAAILADLHYGTKPKVYQCRYCERWHLSSS